MVFNEGFDNTIWMILSSDKKYREEIAKFIYNLPKEIYDSICEYLKEYSYDREYNDYEFRNIKKLIRDNDGINNFYCLEICPYKIKINLKRWDSANDKLNEDIQLLIYYCNMNELNDMDYSVCIGNYDYNSSKFLNPFSSLLIASGDDREYEIYDKNDMILEVSVSCDSEFDNKINLNRMPQELELSDLRDRRSVNRLVRGRKKK